MWSAAIQLEPGDYRFRYVTDEGRWFTDYAAFGVVRNDYGEWDSVVHVPKSDRPAPVPEHKPGVLSAEDVHQLSELMALVWSLTREGGEVCDAEDEFEHRRRGTMSVRPAAAHRARAVVGLDQGIARRRTKSPTRKTGGTKLRRPRKYYELINQ